MAMKKAHCEVEACRQERQERLECWNLRWTQFRNQHSDEDSEHAIGERAQSLRGSPMEHNLTVPCIARPAFQNRPSHKITYLLLDDHRCGDPIVCSYQSSSTTLFGR